jgi:septal ring factor EnvC (AmiA/AmiB activator)
MDLTPVALITLGVSVAIRAIPDLVRSWRKRSEAESDLIIQAIADVKRLTKEAQEGRDRIDRLEAELEEVKVARSHADGQIAVFQMQLDRSNIELELWEGRARALSVQLDDLYRAVSSSEQGKSLPPLPRRDW